MVQNLKDIFQNIENFLFKQSQFERLGVMRIILCTTLFYIGCYRQLNIDQYGIHSLIPRSEALALFSDFYRPAVQLFFWPDQWASIVHILYLGLLFLAAIGLTTRPLMMLTWVIAQGFIHRNFSILFGADVIGALFLFYLSFTRCCDAYTLKPYLGLKHRGEFFSENFFDQMSSVFFRLMQVQIFIIYAYTGFEKLKGSTWWDGTALWTVLVNPQFTSFNLQFLKYFPLFFAIGTFITIVFEVYFPVMVMFKKTRPYWLGLGFLFHLMIGILLSLMPFSLIMLSTYFLFFDLKNFCLKTGLFVRNS